MENPLHNSTLARAFNNVLGDLSRLLQQEIQLAKAEFSEDIGAQIRGGVWAATAALFGVLALMAAAAAAVFALWAAGLEPYWACLIVAAGLGAAALAFFLAGRSAIAAPPVLKRSADRINEDIRIVKEQLS